MITYMVLWTGDGGASTQTSKIWPVFTLQITITFFFLILLVCNLSFLFSSWALFNDNQTPKFSVPPLYACGVLALYLHNHLKFSDRHF